LNADDIFFHPFAKGIEHTRWKLNKLMLAVKAALENPPPGLFGRMAVLRGRRRGALLGGAQVSIVKAWKIEGSIVTT
jgi:hypothetical protein